MQLKCHLLHLVLVILLYQLVSRLELVTGSVLCVPTSTSLSDMNAIVVESRLKAKTISSTNFSSSEKILPEWWLTLSNNCKNLKKINNLIIIIMIIIMIMIISLLATNRKTLLNSDNLCRTSPIYNNLNNTNTTTLAEQSYWNTPRTTKVSKTWCSWLLPKTNTSQGTNFKLFFLVKRNCLNSKMKSQTINLIMKNLIEVLISCLLWVLLLSSSISRTSPSIIS